jgi:division protein CdvB (Snf7/Vps24/ESCRT-III family)
MDEWLRTQIKHGVDLTESEEDLLDAVRVRLNQIMEENGVNLMEIM